MELIRRKRDGLEHDAEEIHALIVQFLDGRVTDYQMSAWLMAAFIRGLSESEMVALTDAMLHSGEVLHLPSVTNPKVDKHSTGGVGDKISLCLAPLVASCGVSVPMISGRGLGHTGGTLDKLESIPGYDVHLSTRSFESVVRRAGVSIIGQTKSLAPADKRIYALRDVTATVACVPLIVASILSKKLAEGIDALVLDVKVGRGAFMKDLASARHLARSLVRVGKRSGKEVCALLTDMDAPTGRTIGNALEVKEAIEVLCGEGPADTRELTLALGEDMLLATGVERSRARARSKLVSALDRGEAFERFAKMVKLHGGDERAVEDVARLPATKYRVAVRADRSGYVTSIDAHELGHLAVDMGAGRRRAEDAVDPAVGIVLECAIGDRVHRGDVIAHLHVHSRRSTSHLAERVQSAFGYRASAPREPRRLVFERIRR